jgi:hypothetical protein
MTETETLADVAAHMDREAEQYRVLRDAARRDGDMARSEMWGDRAAGFLHAAALLRQSSSPKAGNDETDD